MFQHKPWVGPNYRVGISGARVAIVGNSHWSEDDSEDSTMFVISKILDGTWKNIAFFRQIKDYFSFADALEFWNQVIFFNYAPRSIGGADDRYNQIPGEMVEEAKERFTSILVRYKPENVFVFSSKIRWALPEMHLSIPNVPLKSARTGLLTSGESPAHIFLLRHTQGANKCEMTDTVKKLLGSKE
ncbi:hypothetical protein FJ981_05430 [Mesorhizobium sp. B1-1-4]|uniref:hypothetical protein n=2 Tax=Mesorhizobium TaxID=68287 RepID=UPI001125E6A7|nr:hypothetical protein [Mesorhizobium sp. B1-1-4]TPN59799.1 hypothetical protein FJ981_05430 [Mesorhizobium sp. B1-1-4]